MCIQYGSFDKTMTTVVNWPMKRSSETPPQQPPRIVLLWPTQNDTFAWQTRTLFAICIACQKRVWPEWPEWPIMVNWNRNKGQQCKDQSNEFLFLLFCFVVKSFSGCFAKLHWHCLYVWDDESCQMRWWHMEPLDQWPQGQLLRAMQSDVSLLLVSFPFLC